MSYLHLAYLHLLTVLPAFLVGTLVLLTRKGTRRHRYLGRVFAVLMVLTAAITLFMPSAVGPALWGHFGFLHALSLVVLWSVPAAILAIRRGDRVTHRNNLISVYCGGILIAGSFALMPGRLLHGWLFGG